MFFMHFKQLNVVLKILYINGCLDFYISLINKYQCHIIMSYVDKRKESQDRITEFKNLHF